MIRRAIGTTGFAPGHSQVAFPLPHRMQTLWGSQSKSALQALLSQASPGDETNKTAESAANVPKTAILRTVVGLRTVVSNTAMVTR